MLARTLALFAVFFLIPISAYGADALPSLEEVGLRSVVIETCHPVLTDDDKAFVHVAYESISAEGKQIWAQVLATGLWDYDELLRRTGEILRERLVRARETAKMKVAELG